MPRGHANRPGKNLPAATVAGACKSAAVALRRFFTFIYLYLRIHARTCVNIRVAFSNSGPDLSGDPYGQVPPLDDPFSRSLERRRRE